MTDEVVLYTEQTSYICPLFHGVSRDFFQKKGSILLGFWFGARYICASNNDVNYVGTSSLVGRVFDLKFFRWRFDPAQGLVYFLFFFFSVDLLSVNLSLFSVSIIATWEKHEKTKTLTAVQLRRNIWGLVGKDNFFGENTIILNTNRLSVSLNIQTILDRLFLSDILQWK